MTKKKTTKKPAAKATAPAAPAKVLVLRACKADGTSHDGFRWPLSGPVEAPDWKPTKECGNGLHGLLWGVGNYSLVPREIGSRYLVVEDGIEADTWYGVVDGKLAKVAA